MGIKTKKEIIDWLKAIAIALGLGLIVRGFLIAPVVVDGQSMETTLYNADKMIMTKIGDIQRFDVVVFHADKYNDYVKRVIGLEGDTIEYKGDKLYINGKEYDEPYLDSEKEKLQDIYGDEIELTVDFNIKDLLGEEKVPKGYVFVLGDNRRNSKDSRVIGFVPVENIMGEPKVVYFPFKDMQVIK